MVDLLVLPATTSDGSNRVPSLATVGDGVDGVIDHVRIIQANLDVAKRSGLGEFARAGQDGRVQGFRRRLIPYINECKGIAPNDHVLGAGLLLVARLVVRPAHIGSISDGVAVVLLNLFWFERERKVFMY